MRLQLNRLQEKCSSKHAFQFGLFDTLGSFVLYKEDTMCIAVLIDCLSDKVSTSRLNVSISLLSVSQSARNGS